MQQTIIAGHGRESLLAKAVGRDLKGKLSPLFYVVGIFGAFIAPWAAGILYVPVAALWLVPDRRIERALAAWNEPVA
ncbi:MAG: hypothetical protein ACM3NI_00435 [Bacteroidota bacterium]